MDTWCVCACEKCYMIFLAFLKLVAQVAPPEFRMSCATIALFQLHWKSDPSLVITFASFSWNGLTADKSKDRTSPHSWSLLIPWHLLNLVKHPVLPLKLCGSLLGWSFVKNEHAFSCSNTPETGAPLEHCWQNHSQQASSTRWNFGWQIIQRFVCECWWLTGSDRVSYLLAIFPNVSDGRLCYSKVVTNNSLRSSFFKRPHDL